MLCVNFIEDDYPKLHIQTDKEYRSLQIVSVENPTPHTPAYAYENGVYTISETLKGQESYMLIFK